MKIRVLKYFCVAFLLVGILTACSSESEPENVKFTSEASDLNRHLPDMDDDSQLENYCPVDGLWSILVARGKPTDGSAKEKMFFNLDYYQVPGKGGEYSFSVQTREINLARVKMYDVEEFNFRDESGLDVLEWRGIFRMPKTDPVIESAFENSRLVNKDAGVINGYELVKVDGVQKDDEAARFNYTIPANTSGKVRLISLVFKTKNYPATGQGEYVVGESSVLLVQLPY